MNNNSKYAPDRQILKKTFLSAISEGSNIFLFIFAILAARGLGPQGYGEFTYALAYCAVFALIIESGLVELLTREISKDFETGVHVMYNGLGFQLMITPIVIMFVTISIMIFKPDTTSEIIIYLALLAVLAKVYKTSFRGLLRGSGRFDIEAISMTAERIALGILGVIVFLAKWNITQVIIAFSLIKLIDLLVLAMYINHKLVPIRPNFKVDDIKTIVLQLLPFSMTMAIWVLYNYTDTLMLGYFWTANEVGQYGAIYQFFEGMIIIPSILVAVFLPWMSYEFRKGKSGVEQAIKKGTRILIVFSMPVVCISLFASDEILYILFGNAYIEAAPGLAILLSAAPFVFLFWFLKSSLIAIHKTKILVIISGFGVMFNITSNYLVIPDHGLIGACATTFLTEFVTFCCVILVLRKNQLTGTGIVPWLQSIFSGLVFVLMLYVAKLAFGWALLGVPLGFVFSHWLLCRLEFWEADEKKLLTRWRLAW